MRVNIIERLLQIEGDLLEYNPFINENIPRAKGTFLCIDKTDNFQYMLNIIDLAGKVSYTRRAMTNQGDF